VRLDIFVKLGYQSNTKILSAGIKQFARDLLFEHRGPSRALECTKFDFGPGLRLDPAGGAYSAPPDPVAGLRCPTSKGEDMGERGERGREGNGRDQPPYANSRIRLHLFVNR